MHLGPVPGQVREQAAGVDIPQAHDRVLADRCDELAVGAERDALQAFGLARQLAQPLAARDVPQDRPAVMAHRRECPAVGAERDGAHRALVPAQHREFGPVRGVPQAHAAVLSGGGHVRAVRAESHRLHALRMPVQRQAQPRRIECASRRILGLPAHERGGVRGAPQCLQCGVGADFRVAVEIAQRGRDELHRQRQFGLLPPLCLGHLLRDQRADRRNRREEGDHPQPDREPPHAPRDRGLLRGLRACRRELARAFRVLFALQVAVPPRQDRRCEHVVADLVLRTAVVALRRRNAVQHLFAGKALQHRRDLFVRRLGAVTQVRDAARDLGP
nr:hypothetical protein [Azoarcus sp. DN11]